MAQTNQTSGTGVILGIVLAILLAIGGYYFIQSRGDSMPGSSLDYTNNNAMVNDAASEAAPVPERAAPANPDNALAPGEASVPAAP